MTRILNLGILAHVDAGKTTLTERLLYEAGVIDQVGSVDDGNTQTDSLALERERGITIKSAVASFTVDDVVINLIDTPGHPDFIAEVERVLNVLDGVVLVVSAVEGVQAQTRVLMRALQRLKIPTLIFVNKIDRAGAQGERLLETIAEKLALSVVAMGEPHGLGTRGARVTPYGANDGSFHEQLVEVLADNDDTLLAAYVDRGPSLTHGKLIDSLARQTRQALVHPVFFGSAVTGVGVDALTAGIRTLLPAADGDAGAPLSATVFKVDRGSDGRKAAYVRMFAGAIRTRDVVTFGDEREGKITAVRVFHDGKNEPNGEVGPGQIAKVWGLDAIRIGDVIGHSDSISADAHYFAPPTLETVVVPSRPSDKGHLHAALAQLAEQDPLINVRQDDGRQEIYVSLYGEVQKEVIQTTLADEYELDVSFEETTTICIERPIGTGAAVELMGDDSNPFTATVGLRVEPAPVGTGIEFRLEVELGSMPYSFFKAVEETVRQTLRQGLAGWEVIDCVVTMTHSGYVPPPPYGWSKFSSSAGDFRQLTPLVLMSALQQARTTIYEPMHCFHLETPADALGHVMPALARLHAIPLAQEAGDTSYVVEGDIPAARVHALQQELPGLAHGEGVLESSFDHYEPVRGATPTRPRSDHNPLNRQEYLLHMSHRI